MNKLILISLRLSVAVLSGCEVEKYPPFTTTEVVELTGLNF
jgi:hypothetical protein